MAKQETTRAGTKGRKQSQATPTSQPELEGKLSAEQDAGERTHERLVFVPWVDIYETETGLVVVADLPGVSPEVTLENRVLSIYGRVEEESGLASMTSAISSGSSLSPGISTSMELRRTLKDGVLHLAIPRAPEAAAKRIEVRSVS